MEGLDISRHYEIVRALIDELPPTAAVSDKATWTEPVKIVMHKLCKDYLPDGDCEFCATLIKDGKKFQEWLLDVVWYLKTSDEERGIFLGLESEWKNAVNEVASDFCKLLAIKAPLKVLLFEAGTNSRYKLKDHLQELERIGKTWRQHSKGDLLYAINFHDHDHETYFYAVEKDGINPDFSFKLIPELTGPNRAA